jgi:GAF domain-containing protein
VLAALIDALQTNSIAANLDSAALFSLDLGANGQPEWATFIGWWGVDYKEPALLFDSRTLIRDDRITELWVNDPSNPLFFEDIQNDPRLDENARAAFEPENIRAVAFLPLRTAGRWLGVLHLNWTEPHTFSDLERRVFRALMSPFATVFDNHRLFDRLELQLADLAKIQKVTSDLTEAVGVREVLDVLLPQTADVVQADNVCLLLIEGEYAVTASVYPDDQQGLFTMGEKQLFGEHPLLCEVIETGQPVLLNEGDSRVSGSLREAFDRASITANASIPLVSREGLLGVLVVNLSQPGRSFSINELSILQTLSDQATLAIERVRLFDETRRTARRQTLINQITNKMRAAVSVEEVLRIATDELRRATQSARSVAELGLAGHVEGASPNASHGTNGFDESNDQEH